MILFQYNQEWSLFIYSDKFVPVLVFVVELYFIFAAFYFLIRLIKGERFVINRSLISAHISPTPAAASQNRTKSSDYNFAHEFLIWKKLRFSTQSFLSILIKMQIDLFGPNDVRLTRQIMYGCMKLSYWINGQIPESWSKEECVLRLFYKTTRHVDVWWTETFRKIKNVSTSHY